jgi:hypothetical protein
LFEEVNSIMLEPLAKFIDPVIFPRLEGASLSPPPQKTITPVEGEDENDSAPPPADDVPSR